MPLGSEATEGNTEVQVWAFTIILGLVAGYGSGSLGRRAARLGLLIVLAIGPLSVALLAMPLEGCASSGRECNVGLEVLVVLILSPAWSISLGLGCFVKRLNAKRVPRD